ncbi:glycoside hydrolase family 13 protein [Sinomonas sp. P10A9]|uniref:Glycoside hydrolase family 13 protein n=1 Tax=Sinomonas puerhi TaxID=3238584 RepID=A0AB39L4Q6_9MICC
MRLRTRADGGVVRVWVRTVEDAEPRHAAARPLGSIGGWDWWEARVRVHNPVARYRFLLEREPPGSDSEGRPAWLNAAGMWTHDVPDTADFRLSAEAPGPEWAAGAVMYQVFPDRFARSRAASRSDGGSEAPHVPEWAVAAAWGDAVVHEGPDTARQLFGGDLNGIRERLDHLEALGVEVLYLTPIFPARSNHRYDASTFRHVDPLLGGDTALAALVEACHARGIRVIGDLTANHTGDAHEWFRRAAGDRAASSGDVPERSYYYFRPDGSYESWWGVPSLPKLDWASGGLRRDFVDGPGSVVAHWLTEPYGLDGWRLDVGNMTGRLGVIDHHAEVFRLLRATALAARPDALLVAESTNDAAADFQGDTFHGSMSYASLTRPLWGWLTDGTAVNYFGAPLARPPRLPAEDFLAQYRAFSAAYPWDVRLRSLSAIDTHDTARAATVMVPGGQEVAAVLAFTLPGMPLVFAGDEFGLTGVDGEDSRTPMPWDDPDRIAADLRPLYEHLGQLRREPALRIGSLRWLWAEGDVLVFVRELPGCTVLVAAARADAAVELLPGLLPEGWAGAEPVLAVGRLRLEAASVGNAHDVAALLSAAGPSAAVWRLPGPTPPGE